MSLTEINLEIQKEQIKKSVHPISYKTYEVDDELLKFIDTYNSKKL